MAVIAQSWNALGMLTYAAFLGLSTFLIVQALWDASISWFIVALALIGFQHYVTAVHLIRTQLGMSATLPPLPILPAKPRFLSRTPTTRQTCFVVDLLLALLAFPLVPLVDLYAILALFFNWRCSGAKQPVKSSTPVKHSKGVVASKSTDATAITDQAKPDQLKAHIVTIGHSPQTGHPPQKVSVDAWAPEYARRRLGIAGLLQAAPQLFFHAFITLFSHWRDYCHNHGGCPDPRPRLLLLWLCMLLDGVLLLMAHPGMLDVVGLFADWQTWSASGALLREAIEWGVYLGGLAVDVLIYLAWRKSSAWYMRWLPLGVLLLQFPASALILLASNAPKPSRARTTSGPASPVARPNPIKLLLAAVVLAAIGTPLLDLAALALLLQSSVRAVQRVPQGPLGWLLFGAMEWTRWLLMPVLHVVTQGALKALRALCFARDLPQVATVLNGPFRFRVAVDEVWAENYKLARVLLQAALSCLPMGLLQILLFFLRPKMHQPSMWLLVLSAGLKALNLLGSAGLLLRAAHMIGWGTARTAQLAMKLEGAFRAPPTTVKGTWGDGTVQEYELEEEDDDGLTRVVVDLAQPPLTAGQKAGLLRGKVAEKVAHYPQGWVLEVRNLKAEDTPLQCTPTGTMQASPRLDYVLKDAKYQLGALQEVSLRDCDLDDRQLKDTSSTLDRLQTLHSRPIALSLQDSTQPPEAQLAKMYEAGPPNTIYYSSAASPGVSSVTLPNPAAATVLLGSPEEMLPSGLKMLVLDRCEGLTHLPPDTSRLDYLQLLCINRCPLKSLPFGLDSMSQMEVLQLPHCTALTELPDAIGCLPHLRLLDLSGCTALAALPADLAALTALRAINLSGCTALRELPPSLAKLPALKALLLADCSALAPPAFLPGLARTLEVLDISYCSPALHRQLAQLYVPAALRKLVVQGCRLEVVPDRMVQLQQLQVLDLGWSDHILRLPQDMGRMQSLQEVRLRYCDRLREAPAGLLQLPRLQLVDVRDTDCLADRAELVQDLRKRGVEVLV